MTDEYTHITATNLIRLFKNRKISVTEAISHYVNYIGKINPKINAIVQLTKEQAIADAKVADNIYASHTNTSTILDEKPLLGVPFVVKDSINTKDIITTSGTTGRAEHTPKHDATVVSRMKSAGAILLGKTNCSELALPFETDNLVYGRTNNPWDTSRSSGGSSGGDGAMIAAGGASFALAIDAGGSIRLPAHFCGVMGIKPTTGRTPRTGHFPPIGGLVGALSQCGPIARSVDDLALILPLLCGDDGQDPSVVPMPFPDHNKITVRDLKVGYFIDNGVMEPDESISKSIESVVKQLEKDDVTIQAIQPPGQASISRILFQLFGADGGTRLTDRLNRIGTHDVSPLLQAFQERQWAYSLDTTALLNVITQWDILKSEMLAFAQDYDVIISPVSAVTAFRHGYTLNQDNLLAFTYSMLHNLTGWCSASVPVTKSEIGLPIGVQIAAKPWREDIVLAMAKHIETFTGGFTPPPL